MTRVVLVPGALALLPAYASQVDPLPELRAAALAAVRWLGEVPGGVEVLADPQGERVADALLEAAAVRRGSGAYLVVGNGSAKRSEKAPGHLDERSSAFDDALRSALVAGDLGGVDWSLAGDLWAAVDGIRRAADVIAGPARVDLDDDPYGVQYWVMRWGA
ncbi:hypothetical protein QWY28_16405 [Nocardioides sp. SOB77]|uniref:Uncharacterized protein n=1 Tax=Nocardioides oceani TaxID=3058369 RepID=A0ABT8FIN1_9ACTN|nr:hypothetical protein [Nocardioides oceani]MDN4174544.1 hypothetical protein [Nocardioides oceani]